MIAPEWPIIIDLDPLRSRSWVSPTLPGKVNFTSSFGAGLADHGQIVGAVGQIIINLIENVILMRNLIISH